MRSEIAAGVACSARAVARKLRSWASMTKVSMKRVFMALLGRGRVVVEVKNTLTGAPGIGGGGK